MKYKLTVKSVLCTLLAIGFVGCSTGTRYNRSTGQYMDDKGTAMHVKHDIKQDSLVKAADIKIESFRGNVHLTGFVDYPIQKKHAEQIARNAEGVEFVKNDIIVKSQLPNFNAGGAQVGEAAGAESTSRQSGADYQRGTQQKGATQFQGGEQGGWIRGTRTINAVEPASDGTTGNLQNEPAGAEPNASTTQSDANQSDLAQRVRMDLQSDQSLHAQNVMVESKGDKIILRGTVASKEEKEAIEAKAKLIPGVKSVSNKLDVK